MIRRRFSSTYLGVSLASLALCASALGQTSSQIPPEDVASHAFESRKRVRFVGKYMGLVGDRLQLLGMEQNFVLISSTLAHKLLDFEPSVDNVTVDGYLDSSRSALGKQVFAVEAVYPAPKDLELYQNRFRELESEPTTGSERYLRLAEAVHRVFQRSSDAQLATLAVEIMRRCYNEEVASLQGASLGTKLRMLRRLFQSVPLDSLRGQILVELEWEYPESPEIREQLLELGYRHRGGEWISYSNFKRREGFLWEGARWVKALDLEHATVADSIESVNQTNLVLRNRTNRQFQQLAKTGKVVPGMTRNEVIEAAGYPERVRRLRVKEVSIDQWQYAERRIYFFGGEVIIVWKPEVVEHGLAELSEAVKRRARGEPDTAPKKPEKEDGRPR